LALFAVAREDEQRVVDPECEPHAGEHVGGEHRKREALADERDERERDGDRDDRQQQRDQSGHDRAEDEQQHQQRDGKPEAELAVAQILLGERRKVAIERELAGDRNVESGLAVGAPYGIDRILGLVLAVPAERDQHPGGVLVPGDQTPVTRVVERGNPDCAGLLELRGEGLHAPPEARLLDRRRRRADDDDLRGVR